MTANWKIIYTSDDICGRKGLIRKLIYERESHFQIEFKLAERCKSM
jgi:hypothetical protein